MKNEKIKIKQELTNKLNEFYSTNEEILLVSVVTTDGFLIESISEDSVKTESDKLAAISSTVSAISDSSAREVLGNKFSVSIIETETGNMLFVKTSYLNLPSVLMVAVRVEKMNLANARYITRELSKYITSIN